MNEQNLREVLQEAGIKIVGKNSDGWLCCRCPFAPLGFHAHPIDRNPSFFARINPTGASGYQCFSCKQHGSIPALINQLEYHSGESFGNLSTRARLKEMEIGYDEFGAWQDETEEVKPVLDAVWRGLFPMAYDVKEARQYLQARGIGQQTSSLIGLMYDAKEKRILFPVRDLYEGQISTFGFSGRSILQDQEFPHPKYKKVKDYLGLQKSSLILGMEHARDNTKPLLLVEGLFAYAHMMEIGARRLCNPVASMGSHLSDTQAEILIEHGQPVYILYDDDLAGDIGIFGKIKNGQHKGGGAVDKLVQHIPTLVCSYPEDHSGDPDDLTIEELKWVLDNADLKTFLNKSRQYR